MNENPPAHPGYAPPGAYPPGHPFAPPPLAPPKSPILQALGVLSVLFGGLTALGNLWDIAWAALQRGAASPAPTGDSALKSSLAELQAMQHAGFIEACVRAPLMILMSFALAILGIGMMGQRPFVRTATRVWAVLAYAVLVIRALVMELVVMPATSSFMDRVSTTASRTSKGVDLGLFVSFGVRFGTYGFLAFLAVFPTVLLVAMASRSVKDALARPPA